MKVAVLNYTGTVGKTTIAAHLLSPRMNNAPIFAIETINETAAGLGADVEKISGDKFRTLFKKLMMLDDAIIDVGASNIESFLDGMLKFEDSHLEFDYFVIPVTSGAKEQKETIKMIETLSELNIPSDKVKVIFNRVDLDAKEEFAPMFNFAKKTNAFTANANASIYENELFDLLSIKKLGISDLINDTTDYKAKARELGKGGDAKTLSHYTDMYAMKALSKGVTKNLDEVFSVLFN